MLLGFESVASPVVGEMAKKPSSMDDSERKSIAKANAAYEKLEPKWLRLPHIPTFRN